MTKVNKTATIGKIIPLTPTCGYINNTHASIKAWCNTFVTRCIRIPCIRTFIKWGVTFIFAGQIMQGASGNIDVLSKAIEYVTL